jgi:hypothetical protein
MSGLLVRFRALWRRLTTPASADSPATTTAMGGLPLWILVVYLVFLSGVGGWTAWTLWDATPDVQPSAPWADVTQPPATDTTTPVLTLVSPDTIAYGLGRPIVQLRGSGFESTSTVLVDGQLHRGGRFIAPNLMLLALNDEDFRQSGTVIITVVKGASRTNPLPLVISSGSGVTVRWSPWPGRTKRLTVESRLFLLVLMMGLLGGTIASFNSLSNYRGEGKLVASWFLYYGLSPMLGSGMALFLYVIVRAGLLAGTNIELDANSTPWGVVAVSALAGLFYDKTLIKLREVFVTLFNPRDTRTGKLDESKTAGSSGLTIGTTSLAFATKGVAYHAQLDVTGGTAPYSWSVEPDLPGGVVLDPLTGVVSGTPSESGSKRNYELMVSDMNRAKARAAIDFEVR